MGGGIFPVKAAPGREPGHIVVLALAGDGDELARRLGRAGHEVTVVTSGTDLGSSDPEAAVVLCSRLGARTVRTVRAVRRRLGASAIIVCPAGRPTTRVDETIDAGADAILEDGELENMLPVVLAASRHGYVVHPRMSVAVREVAPPLSARERQALSMVTLGCSNREIAQKLHLSESTVKSHLSSSFSKLGVRTRGEATARLLADRGVAAGVLAIPGDHERLAFSRRAPKS